MLPQSKLTFVNFIESTTANEAVESKRAFEKYAATFGIKIQKYHAKIGAFDTRISKESIIAANQNIYLVVMMHTNRKQFLSA